MAAHLYSQRRIHTQSNTQVRYAQPGELISQPTPVQPKPVQPKPSQSTPSWLPTTLQQKLKHDRSFAPSYRTETSTKGPGCSKRHCLRETWRPRHLTRHQIVVALERTRCQVARAPKQILSGDAGARTQVLTGVAGFRQSVLSLAPPSSTKYDWVTAALLGRKDSSPRYESKPCVLLSWPEIWMVQTK